MTLLALNLAEAVWMFIDEESFHLTQVMNVEFKNHLSYYVYFFNYNKKCKVHLIISQLKKSTPTQFVHVCTVHSEFLLKYKNGVLTQ